MFPVPIFFGAYMQTPHFVTPEQFGHIVAMAHALVDLAERRARGQFFGFDMNYWATRRPVDKTGRMVPYLIGAGLTNDETKEPVCGTVACIAGTWGMLKLPFEPIRGLLDVYDAGALPDPIQTVLRQMWGVPDDEPLTNHTVSIGTLAAAMMFGPTAEDRMVSNRLFLENEWPLGFRLLYQEAKNEGERLTVALARTLSFISEDVTITRPGATWDERDEAYEALAALDIRWNESEASFLMRRLKRAVSAWTTQTAD